MKDQKLTLAQIENQNNKQNHNNMNNITKPSTKQLLRTWGFKMAAMLNASLGGMRNVMDKIMSNYLLELKDKEMPQRHAIKADVDDCKTKTIEKENDIHVEKEHITQTKEQIEQKQKEIEEIKIDSEGEFLMSEFNWAKTILTTAFTIILGVALVLFYSSLINNAIFADFSQRINNMSTSDLSIFNSIIDTNLLFTLNAGTIISYLFATLFIAIGMLLHFEHQKQRWINRLIYTGLIAFALGAEILFAYIIENNIYELKMMTGLVDEKPGFWGMIISKEVLTVLSLGFVAYLVWSLLFEVSIKEWEKRNPKKMAYIKIKGLTLFINRKKNELGQLRKNIQQLENDIQILEDKITNLKLRLEHVFFDENEAENRLNDFFNGWLRYINQHSAYALNKMDYESEFDHYKTELIAKHSLVS